MEHPEDHREDQSARPPPPVPGRRRRIGLIAGLVLVVWGLLAAGWTLQSARDLERAREDFSQAETQLRAAELSEGIRTLDQGVSASERAASRLSRAPVAALRWLPVIGTNLTAATVLAEGGRDVGGAAVELLEVMQVIVGDDRSQQLGELSVTYLQELGPPLNSLVSELETATGRISRLPTQGLIGRVAAARERYLEMVEPQLDRAVVAAELVEVLPAFLGADETRRYLVGAVTPSEARGSVGLMGSWSVLIADDGRMDFAPFLDVEDLEPAVVDVPAPHPDIAARYATFGALRSWRNANMTPDFPSAAQVYLSLWENTGRPPLDGVIVADPVVFERLVERGGPVEVPGVTTLAADEVVRFVGVDAYAVFEDPEERKLVLGAVATAAFDEAFEILEDNDLPATFEMLASLAEGGHMLVYSTDPVVQPVLERVGVGGELAPTARESLTVAVNNAAANKVDFFSERRLDHAVELLADGRTAASLTAQFTNHAPSEGYPSYVLGPFSDRVEPGDNLSWISVLCGRTCRFLEAPPGSQDGGRELGRPARDVTLLLPAGEQRTLRYTTETDEGWWWEGDRMVVEVEHLLATTLFGTELSVQVVAPDGARFAALPPGAELDPEHPEVARWKSTASGRVVLRFELAPGPAEPADG